MKNSQVLLLVIFGIFSVNTNAQMCETQKILNVNDLDMLIELTPDNLKHICAKELCQNPTAQNNLHLNQHENLKRIMPDLESVNIEDLKDEEKQGLAELVNDIHKKTIDAIDKQLEGNLDGITGVTDESFSAFLDNYILPEVDVELSLDGKIKVQQRDNSEFDTKFSEKFLTNLTDYFNELRSKSPLQYGAYIKFKTSNSIIEPEKYREEFVSKLKEIRAEFIQMGKSDQEIKNLESYIPRIQKMEIEKLYNSYRVFYQLYPSYFPSSTSGSNLCIDVSCTKYQLNQSDTANIWKEIHKKLKNTLKERSEEIKIRMLSDCYSELIVSKNADTELSSRVAQQSSKYYQAFNSNLSNKISQSSLEDFNRFYSNELKVDPNMKLELPLVERIQTLRGDAAKIPAYVMDSGSSDYISELEYFIDYPDESLGEICEDLNDMNAMGIVGTDSFNMLTKKVNLSYFSCDHDVFGEQIFHHELGHVLSYYAKESELSSESLSKIESLKSCARKNASNVDNPLLSTEEEDFADYVAYSAKREGSKAMMGCTILAPKSDLSGYQNLEIHQVSPGKHSSTFARLLKEMNHTSKSPPFSCLMVMADHPKLKNKCEW